MRKPEIGKDVDDFIKGSSSDSKEKENSKPLSIMAFKKPKTFPVNLPPELDEMINNAVNELPYKMTKHDWILTAIVEKLERK
jgi:hypothetical protein